MFQVPFGLCYWIALKKDDWFGCDMQVKLYASLRVAAGTKQLDVPVQPGVTIRDVLVELTQRYPVLESHIWKSPGELSEHAHVFINGENIRQKSGLDTVLKPDDHVDIFPPLVGGDF